ncbi:hypothetical protein YPC_2838 [Yersinia pestis biovar Medievalis str. Harbin 35]|nr:hypothetical protein YPC_2838 [Yersinia pestis biovar Medievalis str. Harbin 35]EEO88738.1 hypothetical protein YPS_3586 [Yersinia pestis Pestoides A]
MRWLPSCHSNYLGYNDQFALCEYQAAFFLLRNPN